MKWSEIKEKNWFKWGMNKYVLITSLFVVWMIFFDDASLLQHIRIDQEIDELKEDRDFYKKSIKRSENRIEKDTR